MLTRRSRNRTSISGDEHEYYRGASHKRVPGVDILSQHSIRRHDKGERDSALSKVVDHEHCVSGSSGTGKSHLATALGFAACAQGKRVRFWTACALVTHLLELREQRELKQFQAQLDKHDLIILDELGYVPFSKEGAELLFEVVSRAYERVSLIVTTNLPFEQWTEVMGSERLTGAMLDRLTHRVHIIEANGESYRLRAAQKKQKA